MPADASDAATPPTTGPDARDYERYAAVALDDGRCIVYDRDAEGAWLQSTASVSLEQRR